MTNSNLSVPNPQSALCGKSKGLRILHGLIWYGIVPEVFVTAGSAVALMPIISSLVDNTGSSQINFESLANPGYAVGGLVVGVIASVWMGQRIRAIPRMRSIQLLAPGIGLLSAVGLLLYQVYWG